MTNQKDLMIKLVQNKYSKYLEGGLITNPDEQIEFIEAQLQFLSTTQDTELLTIIDKYTTDQEILKQQLIEHQKHLMDTKDQIIENTKEIYETIKKL